MGSILQERIGSSRPLPLGEELILAVSIAAGDAGAVMDRVLRRHRLTQARYNVLRILRGGRDQGLAAKEIGARLLVTSPDVTRLVDPLVERGLVIRFPDPMDRRVWTHRLTERGSILMRTVGEELGILQRAILEALGEDSSRQLVALCEALIQVAASTSMQSEGELAP